MMNLIRSEWIKLRTLRLNIVLPLIGFVFLVGITALIGIFAEVDFDDWRSSELAEGVAITAALPALLLSVIGVLAISSEFGFNTIRPTLAATPNRSKVFAAKALLLAVLGFLYGLISGLIAYAVGYGLLSARGAEGLKFLDSDGTISVLVVGLPILMMLLVLFGFGLGLLIRISPAAVAVAILWPILVEPIAAGALALAGVDDPQRVLPYQSALALLSKDGSEFANGRLGGGIFFAVVVFAIIGVATVINNRRDV